MTRTLLCLAVTLATYNYVSSGHIPQADEQPEVETLNGRVRGFVNRTVDIKKPYYSFQGIPFAEPPVGNLRFEPPVATRNWDGIFDATKEGPSCVRDSDPVVGAEDCLHVNVYTPQLPVEGQRGLPVMVWIYGGAYYFGDSSYENSSPDYLIDDDVIVVMFNYRLGVFGFLTTNDLSAPGNNGLKDQILALRWIKDNIARFGGDPDSITVFGQSAGSSSISYLLLSEQTDGLFNRAILESGSSLCLWANSRGARDSSTTLAKNLKVDTSSSQKLVDGLKKIDFKAIQTEAASIFTSKILTDNPLKGFAWGPVVEPEHAGAVISSKAHSLFEQGKFRKVPTISGFNSQEGHADLSAAIQLYLLKFSLNPSELVPAGMNAKSASTVGSSIKSKYWGLIMTGNNAATTQFISDDMFNRPISEEARLRSAQTNVYFYVFSYKGPLGGNPDISGVAHSEELHYLFANRDQQISEQDRLTRDRLVKLWTNFAKTGNPTPENDPLFGVTWPTINSGKAGDITYLSIDKTLTVKTNPESDKLNFWKDLFQKYGVPPYDTY